MPPKPREWAHGTVYGYRSAKCRCEPCTLTYRAHMRAYQARLNAAMGRTSGRRHHIEDTHQPTPMQSCSCSLSGWNPPWMWTWAPWRTFSEMQQIPFMPAAYADEGMWIDRRKGRKERE